MINSEIIEYRVSSVLNNDRKQFGKKYIFDGNCETCWNSDKGLPQFLTFRFKEAKEISKLKIQFQGGFVGKICILEAQNEKDEDCFNSAPASGEKENKKYEFYPEDSNELQEFNLSSNNLLKSDSFKLIFTSSTDFYGRIILYNLEIFGE